MKRLVGKLWIAVSFVLVLVVLSGCASLGIVQGTQVSSEQLAKFTIGKTTKNEVIAALGDPQDYQFEGGKQILIYKYVKAGIFGGGEGSGVNFIFNENGILKDILKSHQNTGWGHP